MKIKCIIVEDEPKAASLLEDYVRRTDFLQLDARFYDAVQALNYLAQQPEVKLVFLDINLPELSGMDLARILDPRIKIIFTTAHSGFAVNSYEVATVDYLLKPITYTRFLQAAAKALKVIEQEEESHPEIPASPHLFVKSGKKIIQLNWDDIYYIEALKEYISLTTATQKVVVYKRMSEFEALQPANFKRVHKSFIVNLDKIEKVEDNTVHLLNRQIPISKSYKDAFYASIKNRLL
jgi:two-component system, LytTR family, response regulator